jgi:hypothetical protein
VRLVGVDVARALALLGMMATHILPPVVDGSLAWPQALAGGRSSALFALLAGVSMALVTGGPSPHGGVQRVGDAVALTTRALLIGLLGLFLGQLDTPVAVILTYYAVLFVLGLPFLGLGARPLLALSALWCVVVPVLSHAARAWLGPAGPTVPTAESASALPPFLLDLSLTGYYPALPWLAYLLAGMALGRMDLARPATAMTVAVTGATVAAGAWVISRALTAQPGVQDALVASSDGATSWDELGDTLARGLHGVTPTGSWWWVSVVAPHSGTPFDLAHTAPAGAVAPPRVGRRVRRRRHDAHPVHRPRRPAHSRPVAGAVRRELRAPRLARPRDGGGGRCTGSARPPGERRAQGVGDGLARGHGVPGRATAPARHTLAAGP